MCVDYWYNDTDRGNRRTAIKTCPFVSIRTTDVTWTGLGSNWDLRGERPATLMLIRFFSFSAYFAENTVAFMMFSNGEIYIVRSPVLTRIGVLRILVSVLKVKIPLKSAFFLFR
jgi:hypothetical protein